MSKNTTLCYINNKENTHTLLLHRVKKDNDENSGKWIGVGGKFEEGESPEECLIREIREETGLELISYSCRGIVTFTSNEWGTEYMYLYSGKCDSTIEYTPECNEGILKWVKNEDVFSLPMWEGDKIFLNLINQQVPWFSLKLVYIGEKLDSAFLNGKIYKI